MHITPIPYYSITPNLTCAHWVLGRAVNAAIPVVSSSSARQEKWEGLDKQTSMGWPWGSQAIPSYFASLLGSQVLLLITILYILLVIVF